MAGWCARATLAASWMKRSEPPLSRTAVVPGVAESRWRTVCVLPGAGRAVEQDAALEVLAVGDEPLALLAHADDVVRHPVEHAVGQHDGGRRRRSGRSMKVTPAMPGP